MLVLKAAHDKPIASVALSGCGRWLAAVRYTVAVDVLDRIPGQVAFTHQGRSGTWGATFADPGGWLLVWGKDGLTGYRPPAFEPVSLAAGEVDGAAGHGRLVATAFAQPVGAELACWVVGATAFRRRWTAVLNRPAGRFAFDPAGRWLAEANDGVAVRGVADGRLKWAAPGPMHADLCGLLDDRRAVFGDSQFIHIYDVSASRTAAALRLPGRGPVRAAVAPDGRCVVASTGDAVCLLSVEPLAVRQSYHFRTRGKPRCVAFAPDGLTAACGTIKGEMVIWDVD